MNKKLFIVLKISISFGILLIILYKLDLRCLLLRVSNVNPSILSLPVLLLLCQISLSALKWKIILNSESIQVPFFYLLKNYLIGNFISLFLPSSFGGDLYRIYSLKSYNSNSSKNTSSVIFDRISGLFALASISFISYILFYEKIIDTKYFILLFTSIVVLYFLISDFSISKINKYKNKILIFLNGILFSFNEYKKDKKSLFKVLIISFIFQGNIILIVKLYCIALNIDIDFKYLLMVVPLIYLTEALPISINGIGIRESAFIFFFHIVGKTNEEAIAVSLLIILMRYAFGLIFGGSLLFKTIWFNDKEIISNSSFNETKIL